jgi:hypothetical protein
MNGKNIDLSNTGPYATSEDAQVARELSLTIGELRQQRAAEDVSSMEFKKIDDAGNEEQARFEEIPDYALGDTPDDIFNRLYRCIIIKRGLKAAYEEQVIPDVIVDVLADLRHLADHCKVDFGECDYKAYEYYKKEKGA